MSARDRKILTKDEAIAMLPDGESVHTFRNGGMMLIGADWSREDILKAINKYEVETSGDQARAMKHGMVLKDDRGYLFIETKETTP